MDRNTQQQFQAADAAVERFLTEIEQMTGWWESVAATEHTLLRLCDGMTRLMSHASLKVRAEPEAMKLFTALHEYRDSLRSERGA
jgi:hypothetical protein